MPSVLRRVVSRSRSSAPFPATWLCLAAMLGQADDPATLIRALDSDDPAPAIDALVKLGPPAVPLLIDGIANASPRIRSGSAKTLGRMRQAARPALPTLSRALEAAQSDEELARAASEALVALGNVSDPVTPGLGDIVRDPDKSLEPRFLAAWTLGGLVRPGGRASQELVASLGVSAPMKVELFLSIALARGGPFPELKKALGDAAEKNQRLKALAILNAMAAGGAKAKAADKDLLPLARDPVLRPAVVHAYDRLGGERALRDLLKELLGYEVDEDPIYPALYSDEYPVDLLQTFEGLGVRREQVTGSLPEALRWTRANRMQGVTPNDARTLGDVLEGLGEHLIRRWSELTVRWTSEGLPSLAQVSSDLQSFVGTADLLRAGVADEPFWSPGSKKR
jgi:hypothetical protein